jgi:hypothetical protein
VKQLQDLLHLASFLFKEWPPLLHKKDSFENTISRLVREFLFNHKFVSNVPKFQALSSKNNPSCTFMIALQRRDDLIEIGEGIRVPGSP